MFFDPCNSVNSILCVFRGSFAL